MKKNADLLDRPFAAGKRPYNRPQLSVYGCVAELTRNGLGSKTSEQITGKGCSADIVRRKSCHG